MKFIFGTEKIKGQITEVVKVVTDEPISLSGQFNIKQEFTDTTRKDSFFILNKIREATNGESYFTWYQIINHIRYDDRFVESKQTELTEDSDGVLDLADLADENSVAITDIGDYVGELDARITALEGGNE